MARRKTSPQPSPPPEDPQQYSVARVRESMSFDNQKEFDRFVQLNPTSSEIREWLIERTGEDLAIGQIKLWHDSLNSVGAIAEEVNRDFADYNGLEIHKAARATLGFSLVFLAKIQKHFIDDEEKFSALSAAQAIAMVPGLIREIRSLIDQIERNTMAADLMQQELGGAAFAINELLITHRDTPLEEPIKLMAGEIFKKIRAKYIGG